MAAELASTTPGCLRSLVLDLLSPCRPVRRSDLEALTAVEWEQVSAMVRQHRLGPVLGWQLDRAHASLAWPAAFREELAQARRRTALRNLLVRREMVAIHRILAAAGIPYRALKGADLAFHAYPEPGLRPLRDLDIVVPREQVLAAYQALQDAGLRRVREYLAPPEVAMAVHHHLPPLQARCGQFAVELHTHLFHHKASRGERRPDLTDDPDFWRRGRRVDVEGEALCFMSPEDLLLHLIVHGVYDHEFNNGPLLLSDVAFLLQRHALDWEAFEAGATRFGRTRGCRLVLQLVQRYWGLDAVRPAHMATHATASEAQLTEFAALMLCDFAARSDVGLHSDFAQLQGPAEKLGFLLRRAFAPRAQLRNEHALPEGDWRVYLYYPVRWRRQLTQQLPKLWRARGGHLPQHDEVRRVGALRGWLAASP